MTREDSGAADKLPPLLMCARIVRLQLLLTLPQHLIMPSTVVEY